MTDTNQSHGYEEFDQQWKDCEKLWTEIIADNKFGDVETLAILQQYIHHFGVLWQSLTNIRSLLLVAEGVQCPSSSLQKVRRESISPRQIESLSL